MADTVFAPRVLGPYAIVAKIGEGGMGAVYKAHDARLDRFVAVKVLLPAVAGDPDRRRRLLNEARAASALNHPNIVTVYDVGSAEGVDFIAMEYVAGRTLADLSDQRALSAEQALQHALQVADALVAAHAAGIVHRDLKPGNVVVTDDGRVKVLDFGLARRPARLAAEAETVGVRTEEGTISGTLVYMSPEQLEGRAVDARSDIFSFGAMLYEMMSGRRAFQRDSVAAIMAAILQEPPPSTSGMPPAIAAVLARCLKKNPSERFQSASELKEALERARSGASAAQIERPTVAVLPFANLTGGDDQYFSEGLTEEIIDALTRIPALRVTARATAFAALGRGGDVTEIAARLGVAYLVEGSVRRAGTRIRVSAQLVQVSDGCHVWSERYDRELIDVFAIQDEIAAAIGEKLRVELAGVRREARRPTNDLEAYKVYLEGRHHFLKGTPEGLGHGKACLERAVARDPQFAVAYNALGEIYWYLGFYGAMAPKDAFSLATWAVLRALEVDDTLGEAHALLAMLRKELDYNWPEVRRELDRALAQNPTSPVVRLGEVVSGLMPLGRVKEARAEVESLLEMDPLSPLLHWWLTITLMLERDLERFETAAAHFVALEPSNPYAHFSAGACHLLKGAVAQAAAEFRTGSDLSGRAPQLLGWLGLAEALSGRGDAARAILAELHERAAVAYVPPSACAWVLLGLGDVDGTFDWLNRAVDARDPWIIPIRTMPVLDPIRQDPRFDALLRRMNLA